MKEQDLKSLDLVLSEGRPKRGFSISSYIVHILLIILAAVVVVPLVLPLMFCFKTQMQFNYHPWSLPTEYHWENFVRAWNAIQMDQGLINSFLVCLGSVLVTVPSAAMAGYIFARYRSKVTNFLFYCIMAGFFVPGQMVLIPLYKIDISLGLINTRTGVVLALATFGIPFWTMIYRSFYDTLPGELTEAARIDGAGHWATFFKIILPLTKSASILAILLTFMGAWSDYLLSLIIINSQDLFTIQLRISQFIGNLGANYFPQYAAAVIIATSPTIILYTIFRKKIIEGTTLAGALKG